MTRLGNTVTRNVVKPTLQYFPADRTKATGVAVVVAPGGGFTDLLIKYEGIRTVQALNAIGVDAFILKYRLIYVDPSVPLPMPGVKPPPVVRKRDDAGNIIWGPQKGQNIYKIADADARRAMLWVRANATALGIAPNKIGVIGFSAGAFVAIDLALDEPSYRPNFVGSIYGPDHRGQAIPADAPPIFIAVAADDQWSSGLSLNLFKAWRDAKRPAELHVFQTGAHGFLNNGGGADFFMDRFTEWMRANALLPAGKAGTGPLFR